MKYLVLLGDGMADYPIEALGNKTPLEAADTPNLDYIAREGTLGLIDTIPNGCTPGSDIANLSVLGYDPLKYYSGRGPLEAANMGASLGPNDVAFRCNLVALSAGNDPTMEDFTSGHISTSEAKEIITDLNHNLGSDRFIFYTGVGYRHLLVWKDGKDALETMPPHDITGKPIAAFLPKGEGSLEIKKLMEDSQDILYEHPVNVNRKTAGKKAATSIWLWGQGRAPKIESFAKKYQLKGGMISAVDLLNGIGLYAGLKVIKVEGATGYIDTNYEGKAAKALEALKELDFLFLHVEAPDEMGHEGDLEGKIKAIEDFDKKCVGNILKEMHVLAPYRIMVLSDHPTPVCIRTHSSDPSPFAVFSSVKEENRRPALSFCESSAKKTGIFISPGYLLMDAFILDWSRIVGSKLI
ncbi:MAG: cofactor-independent phosphoglycerate mutase [Syntrophaceae bacterium]|nr:cofactor-independent phosphoglycerate mutase [Syntrophaceae bacterium]